jgi:hypothetical protein
VISFGKYNNSISYRDWKGGEKTLFSWEFVRLQGEINGNNGKVDDKFVREMKLLLLAIIWCFVVFSLRGRCEKEEKFLCDKDIYLGFVAKLKVSNQFLMDGYKNVCCQLDTNSIQ